MSIGINGYSQKNSGVEFNEKIAEVKPAKELKGDKHYFVYSYDKAINAYKDEENLTADGQRKLAQSYASMNENILAEAAYAKLIGAPGGNLPEDYFNYAMIFKANGKYAEANTYMDIFSELKPNDLRAIDYSTNKAELSNLQKDNGKYKIEHLNVNTDAEDFGTSFYKDKVVFTSSRSTKLNPKKSNHNNKPYLNIYVSEVDKTQLKTPESFDKELNGKMNEGPASFNKDGSFMAYTENNYDLTKKELIVKLEIYFRTSTDGKWSKPVPFALNDKNYSVGQPALSPDGNTMYFVSDMPGGLGGTDIYKTTKDGKGEWAKAENLGDKINTEGNEMFPFYEGTSGTLYFASNGRFGLGGLDVFTSSSTGAEYTVAENVGTPVNTQYDDFAIIIDGKTNKGYFSSNRVGGKGSDDIYSVNLLAVKKLIGIAKTETGVSIPMTFITLFDSKGAIIDTVTTKADGAYQFNVESNKDFKLTGNKVSYMEGKNSANTLGTELIVKADVILTKKEEKSIPKMEVGTDLASNLEINTVYFDYGKYNIRPDAEIDLDKIVKIMQENPNMVIQLYSHTDCRSTKGFNKVLSDKRAKSTAEYIKKRISKPERIYGKGYSEDKLISKCPCEGDVVSECSEEEHQKNRRTEFIIIKK